MSSLRSIVSSPAFLATWALAGVPAGAMMCHDVALAVTTGAAIPGANIVLTAAAQSFSLLALRLLGAAGSPPTGTALGAPLGPGQNLGR